MSSVMRSSRRVVAASGDEFDHVVVELLAGLLDDLEVVERGAVEDPQHVLGPSREELPVRPGRTEQFADDRDRIGLADVDRDVGATRRCHRIDQFADDLTHERPQPIGAARRERLGHETPQTGVDVTLGGEDRRLAVDHVGIGHPGHLGDLRHGVVPPPVAQDARHVVVVEQDVSEQAADQPVVLCETAQVRRGFGP